MVGILVLMMLWAMTLLSARMLVLSWMLATVSINLATRPLVSSSFATTNCVKGESVKNIKRISIEFVPAGSGCSGEVLPKQVVEPLHSLHLQLPKAGVIQNLHKAGQSIPLQGEAYLKEREAR